MKLTFLGTGTSHGLPYIGCECEVCRSTEPKNKRLRCSILVEDDATGDRLLVDTGPDLRAQLLREKISCVSGVLWTHTHNDHVIGLDDLRPLSDRHGYLPVFGSSSTLAHLQTLFGYAFVEGRTHGGFPRLTPHQIVACQPSEISGFRVTPVPIWHGKTEVFAFRFEQGGSTLVYTTDCSAIPADSWPLLAGADVLVLDALRPRPHPTHFSIAQALEAIEKLRPRRAFLTHIAHEIDHDTVNQELPGGIELAYDGLRLDVETAPSRL